MIDHVYVFIVCPKSDQPVCICPSIRALNNVKHIYIYVYVYLSVSIQLLEENKKTTTRKKRTRKQRSIVYYLFFFLSPPITLSFCSMIFSLFRYTMIASRFDLHSRLNSYQFI